MYYNNEKGLNNRLKKQEYRVEVSDFFVISYSHKRGINFRFIKKNRDEFN